MDGPDRSHQQRRRQVEERLWAVLRPFFSGARAEAAARAGSCGLWKVGVDLSTLRITDRSWCELLALVKKCWRGRVRCFCFPGACLEGGSNVSVL